MEVQAEFLGKCNTYLVVHNNFNTQCKTLFVLMLYVEWE